MGMGIGLGFGLGISNTAVYGGASFTLYYQLAGSTSLTSAARIGPTPTFSRASSATYFDSSGVLQTAAANEPRFDHDPATGEALGLLIEEQRTNLALNSASPATQTVSGVPASAHTVWIEGTGSVAVSGATDGSYGTATEGSPVIFTPSATQDVTLTVSGTVTRFQIEDGAFPTSFIETAGSAVTRAADVCEVTDMGWFNQGGAGTFVYEGRVPEGSDNSTIFYVESGFNNAIGVKKRVTGNPRARFEVFDSGSGTGYNIDDITSFAKLGVAFKENDFSGYQDGVQKFSFGSQFVPEGLTKLVFSSASRASQASQHIKSITYYPTRLSDAELQRLTS